MIIFIILVIISFAALIFNIKLDKTWINIGAKLVLVISIVTFGLISPLLIVKTCAQDTLARMKIMTEAASTDTLDDYRAVLESKAEQYNDTVTSHVELANNLFVCVPIFFEISNDKDKMGLIDVDLEVKIKAQSELNTKLIGFKREKENLIKASLLAENKNELRAAVVDYNEKVDACLEEYQKYLSFDKSDYAYILVPLY